MRVIFAPRFLRQFNKIKSPLQAEIKEKIELFRNPNNHARLRVHKLHGDLAQYLAFSVNYRYRIIFQYGPEKSAELLSIDDHSYKRK